MGYRLPRGRKVRPLVVGGEQPVVADALETRGQHVAQEAADELGGWQRDRALAPGALVPCPDSHLIMVTAEDALIRNRHPMRVARQVVEHLGWPARRRLRIHHPVVSEQRAAARLPRKGLSLWIVRNPAAAPCLIERVEELYWISSPIDYDDE